MNRAFLFYCLLLLVVSMVFTGTASAERSPRQDYCLQESSSCMSGCEDYNVTLWGASWPTPKTALCVTECTIAYVGCIMLRFREGV